MIAEMTEVDLAEAQKEILIRSQGYKVYNNFEN
jgi:hypothetical protein